MSRGLAAAVAAALMLGACTGEPGKAVPGPAPEGTPVAPLQAEPVTVGVGVTLLPGEDGSLPVKVRWSKELGIVEGVAVADGRVYATHGTLEAFDLETGGSVWEVEPPGSHEWWAGEGWWSDGGDRIGHYADGNIWAEAPWNREWLVDVETGALLEHWAPHESGSWRLDPEKMKPIPLLDPDGLQVPSEENHRTDLVSAQGRTVFSIVVEPEEAMQDRLGPWAAGEGIVLVTASGLLMVLDPVGQAWSARR